MRIGITGAGVCIVSPRSAGSYGGYQGGACLSVAKRRRVQGRGHWLDTVHFPDSVRQYPLQGKGFYLMTGTVVQDFGVWNVEVGVRKMD